MNSPAPSAPPYDDNPPPYAPHTMNYMVPPAYPRPVLYPPQEVPVVAIAQRPVAVRKEEPACCTILMAICCCCVLMEEEDNSTRY